MRSNFHIIHVAGKALTTADTLSRAPLQLQSNDTSELQDVEEAFMSVVIDAIPATHLVTSYEVLSGQLASQTPN